MRVMVIVKASKGSEAGVMPSKELFEAMGKFNQELIEAGVMLDGAGLKASSKGARVRFEGAERTVTMGPFGRAGELISGYWIWQVESLDEAIAWVKRCPIPSPEEQGCEVELRPLFEESDFVV